MICGAPCPCALAPRAFSGNRRRATLTRAGACASEGWLCVCVRYAPQQRPTVGLLPRILVGLGERPVNEVLHVTPGFVGPGTRGALRHVHPGLARPQDPAVAGQTWPSRS